MKQNKWLIFNPGRGLLGCSRWSPDQQQGHPHEHAALSPKGATSLQPPADTAGETAAESLAPTWETQMVCQAPGCSLTQSSPLQASGWETSFSVSPSVTLGVRGLCGGDDTRWGTGSNGGQGQRPSRGQVRSPKGKKDESTHTGNLRHAQEPTGYGLTHRIFMTDPRPQTTPGGILVLRPSGELWEDFSEARSLEKMLPDTRVTIIKEDCRIGLAII